ncbi:hypothetical protein WH390_01440 [Candidatus Arsenophonus nilaparvatae]|uniref:hypothetical protein n=1 Tax=Candidatus Arsenophonus nilaparvatae TaxID=1247023 RepID=UPI0005099266|nr:hypothetical protein [Candidatus Arsenophonus nilaparvatae]
MKFMLSILVVSVLFSTTSFAAKEITTEESSGYTKIGELSFQQSGLPIGNHAQLLKEVDKKCQQISGVQADNCYYRVIDKTGNQTNYQNIDLEIFKK